MNEIAATISPRGVSVIDFRLRISIPLVDEIIATLEIHFHKCVDDKRIDLQSVHVSHFDGLVMDVHCVSYLVAMNAPSAMSVARMIARMSISAPQTKCHAMPQQRYKA